MQLMLELFTSTCSPCLLLQVGSVLCDRIVFGLEKVTYAMQREKQIVVGKCLVSTSLNVLLPLRIFELGGANLYFSALDLRDGFVEVFHI